MGGNVLPMGDFGMKDIRSTMLTLLAAVAFVLLIGCVNVANLLLARGASRQKEFAIRRALGAAGWRIARQLLTESVVLALAGGAAGLLIAAGSTRLLFYVFHLDSLNLPLRPIDSIAINDRVFAFALAASCLTGVLFGVAPALSALRGDVNKRKPRWSASRCASPPTRTIRATSRRRKCACSNPTRALSKSRSPSYR
jgi:ABC-type antimicrobial peptide transport system permease subunit